MNISRFVLAAAVSAMVPASAQAAITFVPGASGQPFRVSGSATDLSGFTPDKVNPLTGCWRPHYG